jgi:hypothetical protein
LLSSTSEAYQRQCYQENFKNNEEMLEYATWLISHPVEYQLRPYVPPMKLVQDAIKNTDFRDDKQVDDLTDLLESNATPYIPLGTFKDLEYSLVASAYTLFGDEIPAHHLSDGSHLLSTSFLALDIDAESLTYDTISDAESQSSFSSSTSELNLSHKSDPDHPDGFVFYQIGDLRWHPRFPEHPTDKDRYSNEWRDTDYVIVFRIPKMGEPIGIYIIYNDQPFDQ